MYRGIYDRGRKGCDADCKGRASGGHAGGRASHGDDKKRKLYSKACEGGGYGALWGAAGCGLCLCEGLFSEGDGAVYPQSGRTGDCGHTDSEHLRNRRQAPGTAAGTSGNRRMYLHCGGDQRTGLSVAERRHLPGGVWSA